MASNSNGRCVYVGSIPFSATEEQVLGVCELIGPVQSLRLMQNKETGKHKGYAFCVYKDEETALCALRNLNGYEFGGRRLRVNIAGNRDAGSVTAVAVAGGHAAPQSGGQPAGVPGEHDALARYLAAASTEDLSQLILEMNLLGKHDMELARKLLQCNPALVGALCHAQFVLGAFPPLKTLENPQALCAGQKRGLALGDGCEGSQGEQTDRPSKLQRMEEVVCATSGGTTVSSTPYAPVHSYPELMEYQPEFIKETQSGLLQQRPDVSPVQKQTTPYLASRAVAA